MTSTGSGVGDKYGVETYGLLLKGDAARAVRPRKEFGRSQGEGDASQEMDRARRYRRGTPGIVGRAESVRVGVLGEVEA